MTVTFMGWLRSLFSRQCQHTAEQSIDESGNGKTVEWQCIYCDKIRIDTR